MQKDRQPDIAVPVSAQQFKAHRQRILHICLGVLAVVLLAGYLTYRHYMDPMKAREALDEAKRFHSATRYEQSILAASRAIGIQSDYADAYYLRAQTHAAQRELEPAAADYSELIKLEPKRARAYEGRCEVNFLEKNYQTAVSDCSHAIEIDTGNARTYNLRGAARRELKDLPGSLDDLDHALKLAENIDNLYQRAATYRAMGKMDLAIGDFDKAVFLFPGNPEVYRARAEAKRAMGDEKGAQRDYLTGKQIERR